MAIELELDDIDFIKPKELIQLGFETYLRAVEEVLAAEAGLGKTEATIEPEMLQRVEGKLWHFPTIYREPLMKVLEENGYAVFTVDSTVKIKWLPTDA